MNEQVLAVWSFHKNKQVTAVSSFKRNNQVSILAVSSFKGNKQVLTISSFQRHKQAMAASKKCKPSTIANKNIPPYATPSELQYLWLRVGHVPQYVRAEKARNALPSTRYRPIDKTERESFTGVQPPSSFQKILHRVLERGRLVKNPTHCTTASYPPGSGDDGLVRGLTNSPRSPRNCPES